MTTVGVLIGIFAPHHLMPTLLSHEATDVWRTMVLFTILAAPVAAIVYAVAAYSLIAWRHRGNQDEPPEDGPPLRGNSTVTAIWLGTLDAPRPGAAGLGSCRLLLRGGR